VIKTPIPRSFKSWTKDRISDTEIGSTPANGSSKSKYLVFGHGHRPLSGKGKNVPYASLRGLLHARELDFDSDVENFKMEEPSYGIIFVNENNLTLHIHDFMNKGKIYEGDENYLGFPNID